MATALPKVVLCVSIASCAIGMGAAQNDGMEGTDLEDTDTDCCMRCGYNVSLLTPSLCRDTGEIEGAEELCGACSSDTCCDSVGGGSDDSTSLVVGVALSAALITVFAAFAVGAWRRNQYRNRNGNANGNNNGGGDGGGGVGFDEGEELVNIDTLAKPTAAGKQQRGFRIRGGSAGAGAGAAANEGCGTGTADRHRPTLTLTARSRTQSKGATSASPTMLSPTSPPGGRAVAGGALSGTSYTDPNESHTTATPDGKVQLRSHEKSRAERESMQWLRHSVDRIVTNPLRMHSDDSILGDDAALQETTGGFGIPRMLSEDSIYHRHSNSIREDDEDGGDDDGTEDNTEDDDAEAGDGEGDLSSAVRQLQHAMENHDSDDNQLDDDDDDGDDDYRDSMSSGNSWGGGFAGAGNTSARASSASTASSFAGGGGSVDGASTYNTVVRGGGVWF